MLASVIIATFNEEKYIENCISSLENQSLEMDNFEILIVDGGSSDKTRSIVKTLMNKYNNIRFLENIKKIQSTAFNIGISNSKADYVFIVGAHAKYPADFIEKSLESIKEEDVDCVGGKIIMTANNKLGTAYGAVRNTPFGGGISPYRYANTKKFVETVAFGCYKKSTLISVGGYNEKLIKNQDNDLNKRIIKNGGKILFNPEIEFYYYTRESYSGIIKQLFNYGYWEARLVKRQKNQLSLFTVIPSLFVIYSTIAVVMMFLGNSPMLIIELLPYLFVFLYIYIKYLLKKRINILLSLILYLIIHFSIGLGFIVGFVNRREV